MVTNKASYKLDPSNGNHVLTLPANLQIKFSTKTTLYDATGCLRTQTDTASNAGYCIPVADLSEITPVVTDINSGGALSSRSSLQRTCKVDYHSVEVTNQCFGASTVIAFKKKTTVLGVDYIITEHDAAQGATMGFRADRFSN